MIRINLAPPSTKRGGGFGLPDVNLGMIFGAAALVLVLFLGVWWWSLSSEIKRLNTEIAENKKQAEQLKVVIAEGQRFRRDKEALEKRVNAIEVVARRASGLGRTLGLVVVSALVAWVLLKYVRRRLFLRRLRIARISPEDLNGQLETGKEIVILDLRTPLDVVAAPYIIPGARWITTDALGEHMPEVPRDRDVVAYCS